MSKIIVTGATSMIGAAVVREALAQDRDVVAVVRKNSSNFGNIAELKDSSKLEIVECDIQDYGKLDAGSKCDAFLHLAWEKTDAASRDDVYAQTNNIYYTLDAVGAAERAGCSVFVNTGSQAEYGRTGEKLRGDTACNPESGYGIAKYAAGKLGYLAASQAGIRYCHTRILSTYGEGMDGNTLIAYLIKSFLKNESPILTKCEQLWDFMYVQDTARALLAIVEKGKDGKAYPIGIGKAKELCEYVEKIRDIVNPSINLAFGTKEYYPHQPMYLCADISQLQADTGFEPIVSFEAGIKKTVDWFKTQMEDN